MDALALLCTLHADGPSTLKNLRQAGCASLGALESMEEDRLSGLLGGPPAVARRFLREARHLRERLDPGILDREETHVEGPVEEAVAPAAMSERPAVELPAGESPAVESIEALRDPMAEVLLAWRERDHEEAPEPSAAAPAGAMEFSEEETPPRPVRARPEFEFGTEIAAAMREIASAVAPDVAPAPITPSGSQASPAGLSGSLPDAPLVDGLSGLFESHDADLARRLGEEGIEDLLELSDSDVVALSERLGFGYTRILRVVQLARRAATGAALAVEIPFGQGIDGTESRTARVDEASTPKLSVADRPRRSAPSILELEWNLEIQPTAPPRGRARPGIQVPDAQRESAGGPFA